MSVKQVCDFCEQQITTEYVPCVSVFENDKTALEKDACPDCLEIVKRLFAKSIDKLKLALDAASDR